MSPFHCALCSREDRQLVGFRDSKTGAPLQAVLCAACGLVQLSGIPTKADLRQFYSHHYRSDYKGSLTPKSKHIYRAACAAADRLKFLNSNAPDSWFNSATPRSILDIGAGGGEFVCLANWSGYAARGVEPNLGYSDFAREHYAAQIETLDLDHIVDHRADCLSMFHVLEHIPDPVSVMSRLYEIVNPGGLLLIEVPNIEQADASPSNIFFSAHLYYFSKATLVSAASSFFKPIALDNKGNLRALFLRRDSPIDLTLPTAEDVRTTMKRINRKGWLEYITVGGGYKKPVVRLLQYYREARMKGRMPIEIMKTVAAESRLDKKTPYE